MSRVSDVKLINTAIDILHQFSSPQSWACISGAKNPTPILTILEVLCAKMTASIVTRSHAEQFLVGFFLI
jgi:hypothetical protein